MAQIKHIAIPQSKKADTLLLKIAATESELDKLMRLQTKELDKLLTKHEREQKKYNTRLIKLNDSLKKSCTHITQSVRTDFDYHRREEWEITTCNICNKQLSRK
jgi:NAD-dependent SIR2 family protein deacetylase